MSGAGILSEIEDAVIPAVACREHMLEPEDLVFGNRNEVPYVNRSCCDKCCNQPRSGRAYDE
jgi:hypothetical protein